MPQENEQLSSNSAATRLTRYSQWVASVEACEKHIKLASGLIATGLKLLQQANAGSSIAESSKAIANATAAIEKGAKIERESRQHMMILMQRKPPNTGA